MTKTKRITISFNDKDTDFLNFINHQENASLSIRLICQKWIAEHGIDDIVKFMATNLSTSEKARQSLSPDFQKQDLVNVRDNKKRLSSIALDLNDNDFDEL